MRQGEENSIKAGKSCAKYIISQENFVDFAYCNFFENIVK